MNLNELESKYQTIKHLISNKIRCTPNFQTSVSCRKVVFKLENQQLGGSFKIRGALANALLKTKASQVKGFCAVSAGNHAIAAAIAGKIAGKNTKVVIPKCSTNSERVNRCKTLGAEVILTESKQAAFDTTRYLVENDGLELIHPFDSIETILGAGTIAEELLTEYHDIDGIFVPIGGGGLISGIALLAKKINPTIKVIGVEPENASGMATSIACGKPTEPEVNQSIADSLCPPLVGSYCYEVCRRHVDHVIKVSDDEIVAACRELFADQRIAAEPAGAAGYAGYKKFIESNSVKHPAVVISGYNLPALTFAEIIGGSSNF